MPTTQDRSSDYRLTPLKDEAEQARLRLIETQKRIPELQQNLGKVFNSEIPLPEHDESWDDFCAKHQPRQPTLTKVDLLTLGGPQKLTNILNKACKSKTKELTTYYTEEQAESINEALKALMISAILTAVTINLGIISIIALPIAFATIIPAGMLAVYLTKGGGRKKISKGIKAFSEAKKVTREAAENIEKNYKDLIKLTSSINDFTVMDISKIVKNIPYDEIKKQLNDRELELLNKLLELDGEKIFIELKALQVKKAFLEQQIELLSSTPKETDSFTKAQMFFEGPVLLNSIGKASNIFILNGCIYDQYSINYTIKPTTGNEIITIEDPTTRATFDLPDLSGLSLEKKSPTINYITQRFGSLFNFLTTKPESESESESILINEENYKEVFSNIIKILITNLKDITPNLTMNNILEFAKFDKKFHDELIEIFKDLFTPEELSCPLERIQVNLTVDEISEKLKLNPTQTTTLNDLTSLPKDEIFLKSLSKELNNIPNKLDHGSGHNGPPPPQYSVLIRR